MKEYWDKRYLAEGKIWGDAPSRTVDNALEIFRRYKVESVLVPGSGYGRNTKLFSGAGFKVTGVEISPVACQLAGEFDRLSRHVNASVLDMSCLKEKLDAVYGFNVLHLFRASDRQLLIKECLDHLNTGGIMYFTVFSEKEASYGRGTGREKDTFESKPGRPAHYFTSEDLNAHFAGMEIIETGVVEEPEDHGDGPHTHILRYICVKKP
jgi:SAM-dependent methyltransferase